MAQPVQPRRLDVPDRPRQGAPRAPASTRSSSTTSASRARGSRSERFPGKVKEPLDATIPRFLAAARKALKPFDVKLGVDVFGLAADHDLGIGQDIALIAKHVDVISPMLYPNHYTAGELGIQDPNGDPSSIVALSMGSFRCS